MPGKYDRFKRVGSNLYREPGTGLYYARKKIAQKNHWESLGTTDRLEACKQRDHWIRKLQEAGGMRPKNWRVITLREMCEKARNNLGGKKASIRENVSGLLSTILRHWPEGGEVQFSRIKVSGLKPAGRSRFPSTIGVLLY